jgi:hypothetical protein
MVFNFNRTRIFAITVIVCASLWSMTSTRDPSGSPHKFEFASQVQLAALGALKLSTAGLREGPRPHQHDIAWWQP